MEIARTGLLPETVETEQGIEKWKRRKPIRSLHEGYSNLGCTLDGNRTYSHGNVKKGCFS